MIASDCPDHRARRNVRLLMVYTVITNAGFIIPVIVPFYQDALGIGFREFLIAEAVFAAVVVLLEVPSGWISDVWQRRQVLMLGAFFGMLGHAVLLCGAGAMGGFAAAVAGQAIIGIAISLISGTNLALMYDTMAEAGCTKAYRKLEGKRSAVAFYSVAAASVAGGLLFALDARLPLAVEIVIYVGAIIAAWRMHEPVRLRAPVQKHPLADMAETVRYAVRGHADIAAVLVFAAILFSGTKIIMWAQQPYYVALDIAPQWYGVLMAAGFMLAGVSSHLAHRLDHLSHRHVMLGACMAAVVVCLSAGAAGAHIGGVGLLMLGGSCLYGVAGPRVTALINARVDGSRRATILSAYSLCVSLMFIPVSFALGRVNDAFGIGMMLVAMAGWLMVACVLVALVPALRRRRLRRRNDARTGIVDTEADASVPETAA